MSVKSPILLTRLLTNCGVVALIAGELSLSPAQAAFAPPPVPLHTVTLGWNPVAENPAVYRLHIGSEPLSYTRTVDAGTETKVAVDGVEFGKTYYFAVSAINSGGYEGPLSSEIRVTIAPPPLPVGGIMAVNASGQTGLEWSFPRSELGSSPEFIIEASTDLVNWSPTDTVRYDESSGGDAETARFSWPVQISGDRKFYRLTSRNWMGFSTR